MRIETMQAEFVQAVQERRRELFGEFTMRVARVRVARMRVARMRLRDKMKVLSSMRKRRGGQRSLLEREQMGELRDMWAAVVGEGHGLRLGGEELRVSKDFVYLGIPVQARGADTSGHVQRVRAKAERTIFALRACGLNGRGWDVETKREVYRKFVRPQLEYGLDVLPMLKRDAAVLQRTQSVALRVLFSLGASTSVEAMEGLLGVESVQV